MDTRQRILEAARSRFVLLGFSKVTMDEIASDLGMSKRTIYQHFTSKQALLREAMLDKATRMGAGVQEIVNRVGLSPAEKLEELVMFLAKGLPRFSRIFLEDMHRNAPDLWEELDGRRNRVMKESFRKLIVEGQQQGDFRRDLNLDLLLQILEVLLQRIVSPEALSQIPRTAAQVVVEIIEILSIGIMTDKGRRALPGPLKEGGIHG